MLDGLNACGVRIPEIREGSKGKHRSERKPLPETPSGSEVTDVSASEKPEKVVRKEYGFVTSVEGARDNSEHERGGNSAGPGGFW